MEQLRKDQAALLMQIVSDQYPNQQIFHLSDGKNNLHDYIFELAKEKGFEFDFRYVGGNLPDLPLLQNHPGCTVETLDLKKRAYNKHTKLYEYVFVTIEDEKIEKEIDEIFKKIFRIMKNAGVLVLFLERDGTLQKKIDKILEEGYFVAVNHIEIFDSYDVVNARKMHGWGAYMVGF